MELKSDDLEVSEFLPFDSYSLDLGRGSSVRVMVSLTVDLYVEDSSLAASGAFFVSLTSFASFVGAGAGGTGAGSGVSGRLAVGVALPLGAFSFSFSFFCFFLRPTIGAISTSGSTLTGCAAIVAVSFFKASLRCLRCWLLVVDRTGAEPTLLGGGELVRDAEMVAEIMEALSEINSLTGVSGRIAALAVVRTEGPAKGAPLPEGVGGASTLGVCTTRRVLGAARAKGDDTEAVVGVGSAGNAESLSDDDFSAAEAVSIALDWVALVAAAMLSIPGVGRFSGARCSALAGPVDAGGAGDLPLSTNFSVAAFLLCEALGLFAVGLEEETGGVGAGCETLGVPRAGKSSSCSVVFCVLTRAMSLDKPLSTASALIFFFASGTEVDVAFFALCGVGVLAVAFTGTIGKATGGVCGML